MLRMVVPARSINCLHARPDRHPFPAGSATIRIRCDTAYQVDSLISDGFDGSGHTIVIVDAFQNPNLVSQVAFYDNFYGLPPINLTQIAPDGLTDFVPGDPNMTSWAEEISLDVEWAHAIAPGANIVLVLAKTNDDADILSALRYAVDNNLGDVISMSFGENENCLDPDLLSAYHDVFAAATQSEHHPVRLVRRRGRGTANLRRQLVGESGLSSGQRSAGDGRGRHRTACSRLLPSCAGLRSGYTSPSRDDLSEIVWNEGPPFGDFQDFFASTLRPAVDSALCSVNPPINRALSMAGTRRASPTSRTTRPFSMVY